MAAAAVVFMLLLNVFRRESYTGDEAFYGMTAVNMVQSPGPYLLRPSYYPAGDFLAEKDAFAHPPVNSYFYALTLWVSMGSLVGLEFLNAVCFALLMYFVWKVLRLFDPAGAGFAVLLLAVSPSILAGWSQLEAEPLMITFGMMSLYCALRAGFSPGQRRWLFLSGLCFGMSFAIKLWLAGPLALALATVMVIRARQEQVTIREKLLVFAVFGLAALIPSALHLLAVAWFYPQDLGFWLKNIYFGIFTKTGISGGKFGAAAVPNDWVHPWWYYAATLYRDHFFLLPIILLGGTSLFPQSGIRVRGLLAIIFAGTIGVLPLSLMTVKEPLYILACAVFLYLLAGACLAALARRFSSGGQIDPLAAKVAVAAIAGLMVLFPVAYALGVQPTKITATFTLAHSVVMALFLVAIWLVRRSRRFRFDRFVYAACAALLAAAFCYQCVTRRQQDKVLARLIQPYVQPHATRELSFVGSNFKSQQLTTFRRGCYWEDLPGQQAPQLVLEMPKFSRLRVFIIDAQDQQKGHFAHWINWLEKHAVEKTAELNMQLGKASGLRLFVR